MHIAPVAFSLPPLLTAREKCVFYALVLAEWLGLSDGGFFLVAEDLAELAECLPPFGGMGGPLERRNTVPLRRLPVL